LKNSPALNKKQLCEKFKIGEVYNIYHIFPEHKYRKNRTTIINIDKRNDRVQILSGMFLDIPTWVETERFIEQYKPQYYGINTIRHLLGFIKKEYIDTTAQHPKTNIRKKTCQNNKENLKTTRGIK